MDIFRTMEIRERNVVRWYSSGAHADMFRLAMKAAGVRGVRCSKLKQGPTRLVNRCAVVLREADFPLWRVREILATLPKSDADPNEGNLFRYMHG